MGRHSRSVALHVSGRRSPWVPALVVAVVFLATSTAGAETGRINLKVADNDILIQDARVSIHTPSGESLDMQARTNKAGIATFVVPAGSYKFCVDRCGDRIWSDVVHTLPNEESEVELALKQLIKDKTLNPKPVRFDGTPPEKEPVMLASLVDLSGILTQSTVATVNRDKLYWYINDHLGVPMMIVDENQAVVWEGYRETFGDTAITVNTIENNFRFPGQYFDAESGLHYNYHRYYDPSIGRYLRTDPIGLAGMDPNIYGYVLNDPVNLVDPIGLLTEAYRDANGGGWKASPQRYNPSHSVFKNWRYSHTEVGGSIVGTDYSGTYHSRDEGFKVPNKTGLSVSQTLIGGGTKIVFDILDNGRNRSKPKCQKDRNPVSKSAINLGNKYIGISVYPVVRQVSINIGIGLAPPASATIPIDTIDHLND